MLKIEIKKINSMRSIYNPIKKITKQKKHIRKYKRKTK
jgi:hypothetical protein